MVANEITFEAIDSEGCEVIFDKEPTKVLFGYCYLLHALSIAMYNTQISKETLLDSDVERTGSDFPPTFKIYVCPLKSEKELNISPRLKVTGLGEGCRFQLVIPSEFNLNQ